MGCDTILGPSLSWSRSVVVHVQQRLLTTSCFPSQQSLGVVIISFMLVLLHVFPLLPCTTLSPFTLSLSLHPSPCLSPFTLSLSLCLPSLTSLSFVLHPSFSLSFSLLYSIFITFPLLPCYVLISFPFVSLPPPPSPLSQIHFGLVTEWAVSRRSQIRTRALLWRHSLWTRCDLLSQNTYRLLWKMPKVSTFKYVAVLPGSNAWHT